ncbi:MAG: 3-methyl-2-oxobutanoate dehydrogenase (2-methylpropanoyl-transferring) subunit alpha, partial [Pseudomonadota bacterium]
MTKKRAFELYVPEPECRPGDTPDFTEFDIPEAGATERPPVDASAKDIDYLAYDIIRVLDDEGKAIGPWAPEMDE